jgi:hypothetical protein
MFVAGFFIRVKQLVVGDLFDANDLKLNADKFLAEVKQALDIFGVKLRRAEWNEDIWKNYRNKMDAIIEHCKR